MNASETDLHNPAPHSLDEGTRFANSFGDPNHQPIAADQSLKNVLRNVEVLDLYAKAVVRLLAAIQDEALAIQALPEVAGRIHSNLERMPLDFITADVDRLVIETRTHLRLLQATFHNHET